MKTNVATAEHSELLIFPTGEILAHNITPEMAAVLSELDPQNELMRLRAGKILVAQASSLQVPATSLSPVATASKDARLTCSQDGCATHISHEPPKRN